MLCTQILNGLVSGLKPLSFNVSEQFDVLAVSFDPSETPELANQKKDAYLKRYARPGAEKGFHFLTGDEPAINLSVLDYPLVENLNALAFDHDYKASGVAKKKQSARFPTDYFTRRARRRIIHPRSDTPAVASVLCSATAVPFFMRPGFAAI